MWGNRGNMGSRYIWAVLTVHVILPENACFSYVRLRYVWTCSRMLQPMFHERILAIFFAQRCKNILLLICEILKYSSKGRNMLSKSFWLAFLHCTEICHCKPSRMDKVLHWTRAIQCKEFVSFIPLIRIHKVDSAIHPCTTGPWKIRNISISFYCTFRLSSSNSFSLRSCSSLSISLKQITGRQMRSTGTHAQTGMPLITYPPS